jgi:multidrug efflux pump subunit AcrA (membrane-fusion protein)
VPGQQTALSFETAGIVTKLPVAEGDVVKAGDVLASLDTTLLEADVREAEAALAVAQANLEKAQAGSRPEEIQQAEGDLSASIASVSEAVASRDNIKQGATEAEIAQAQVELQSAFIQEKQAQDQYNVANGTAINADPDYQEKHPQDHVKLDQDLIENRADSLSIANQNLAAAQATLDQLLAGPKASDLSLADAQVWVAAAERDAAQAYLDLLREGPRPENIAVAQAQVEQQQAALDAAKAARDKAMLLAPFDGVVSTVSIRENEWANPGQEIVLLAGGEALEVETTDLNEIDVARVKVGDTVTVTFDALPDVTIQGKVASIAPKASEGAGVNYTVRVTLDEVPDGLRWGMTAFVDIAVE